MRLCRILISAFLLCATCAAVAAEHDCVVNVPVLRLASGPEGGATPEVETPPGLTTLNLKIRLPKKNKCLFGGNEREMGIQLHVPKDTAQKIKIGSRLSLSYDRIEVFGENSMHHEDAWQLIKIVK